jgi:hypothetical protein
MAGQALTFAPETWGKVTIVFYGVRSETFSTTKPALSRCVSEFRTFRREPPMRSAIIVAALSATLLAACGTREPERAQGGAAAGAATGAGVGVIGGPVGVVAGGAIGAAAGATAGAVTKPSQVNMGPPPWH